MVWRLPVAAVLLFILSCAESLAVDKSDGGYTDLLISIHKDVPYNETIVVNIKSLLRSSSHFLHRATNGLVYFKHVTINFPHTWPKRSSARNLSSSLFEKSDVRIDHPREQWQKKPFTKQVKGYCGKRGFYIQFTPTFLAELNDSTTKKFGNPAYMFVHEWAHYRYGVFDEYSSDDDGKYPRTYCEYNITQGPTPFRLNACSRKIVYSASSPSGGFCGVDPPRCRFSKDCIIRGVTNDRDPVESSIMFMPYIANVTHFCDSTNGTRRHNVKAPNEQNDKCAKRSTWDVISENEDFKNLARANISKRIEVTFEETQHKDDLPQRVVLILDVSPSMKLFYRMSFLKEAATRYIKDIANGSRRLAIVKFSETAEVHHPIMPVNADTRQSFLNAVTNLTVDRLTCIGCGLQRGLEVLNTTDETPEGGIMLLMTDGEQNVWKPKINDVLPELTAAKAEVSTMAMGASADNQIEKLATLTGGKAFFFPDLKGDTAIRMDIAFVESTTTQGGADDDYIRIADIVENFTTKLEKKFILDSSLGNNTVIIFDQLNAESADVSVTLIDPSGKECTMCVEQGDKKTKTTIIPNTAQDGEWTIRLESPSSEEVNVCIQVKSQRKNLNDEPIRVRCYKEKLQVQKPNEAIIYAEVYKGQRVVLDATVVAEVSGPNPPHTSTVLLHDDGQRPDLRTNDGVYSGYFVEFTGQGRYVVIAYVLGDERTRESNPKVSSGSFDSVTTFPALSETLDPSIKSKTEWSAEELNVGDMPIEDGNQTGKPTGAFQRVVFTGSFEVTENITQRDVPPDEISDLNEIARLQANNTMEVQLSWTWPGAQLSFGNASAVDIRASKDEAKLKSEFEKQKQMTMADVVEGDLDPLPVGRKHEVTFVFPSEWATRRTDGALDWTIFIAARVVNSYGLKSDSSNIVEVIYKPPSVKTTVVTTTPVTTTTEATTTVTGEESEQKSRGLSQPWVWLLISGIVVVILIAAVLAVLFRSSAKNHSVYDVLFGRWRADQSASAPVADSQMTQLNTVLMP